MAEVETTDTHKYDLVLERIIAAPAEALYRCYTEPDLVCEWFCPKPWKVTKCVLDVRAGGATYHRMEGPNGEASDLYGQYTEVVPGKRVVTTDAYIGDWVPTDGTAFLTSIITFEDLGDGTSRYRAVARHWSEEAMKQHEDMGFHDGWGAAADQLEELAKTLPVDPDTPVRPALMPGGSSMMPHLVFRDTAKAMDFYKAAFGAEELIRLPGPNGKLVHASMMINAHMVMMVDEMDGMLVHCPEQLGGSSVTLHLSVTDAKGVIDRAVKAGAKLIMPAEVQFWGDLYGMIEDPFGYFWSIATPGENAPRTNEALQDAMAASGETA